MTSIRLGRWTFAGVLLATSTGAIARADEPVPPAGPAVTATRAPAAGAPAVVAPAVVAPAVVAPAVVAPAVVAPAVGANVAVPAALPPAVLPRAQAPIEPPPPPGEPPPPPAPGAGLVETTPEPMVIEQGPPAGSAPGLVMTPPSAEERSCAADHCVRGTPETLFPLFEPTARFQIPYTGAFNPRYRSWSVFAAETLTYDSNIFASQNNVEDDWISNTSVGASYRREGSTFWALATASLTYAAYFEHDEQSALNFYGNFQFGWKGSRFYASIDDQVGYLQNPIVIRDNLFVIIDQTLESYWINTLVARAGYECARYRAELSYTSDLFNAGDGVVSAFDNHENSIRLRGDYYVSEKTSVGAYGDVTFLTYSDETQSDYDAWGAGATFSWRPVAKVGVLGTVGAAWLSSDDGSDHSTPVGTLDIAFDPTSTVSTFIGWARTFEPSLGATDQIVDLFRVRGQAILGQCWTATAQVGFQLGDVQGSSLDGTKDYDLWFFDLMIHRPIGEHWAIDGGYQFTKQNSDSNGIDFDRSRVTVGVSFSF